MKKSKTPEQQAVEESLGLCRAIMYLVQKDKLNTMDINMNAAPICLVNNAAAENYHGLPDHITKLRSFSREKFLSGELKSDNLQDGSQRMAWLQDWCSRERASDYQKRSRYVAQ